MRTDSAVRLEETIAGALNGWDALTEENNRLVREALRGGDQPRLEIARKISRMLDARGFRPGGGDGTGGGTGGQGSGGGGERGPRRKIELHADPTYIEGPATRRAEIGKTAFMTFYVDAVDEFWNQGRGTLDIETDHTEIGPDEIKVGKGRNGRVRVSIAIPESAVPGTRGTPGHPRRLAPRLRRARPDPLPHLQTRTRRGSLRQRCRGREEWGRKQGRQGSLRRQPRRRRVGKPRPQGRMDPDDRRRS